VDPAHEAGLVTCLRRGEGRHGDETAHHEPDIAVDTLDELITVLKERFHVPIPS
jgi:phosphoglycolate phosphatase-like HAD superfamily hydrolase